MKIEITFRAEPDDDDEYRQLDGMILRMDGVRDLTLSTAIDMVPDGDGGKLPLDTGSLSLTAHGPRAMWDQQPHVPNVDDPGTYVTMTQAEFDEWSQRHGAKWDATPR